jgi:preprotein translocase subunit SecG
MNIFENNPAIWIIIIMFIVGCTVIYLGSLSRYRSDKKNKKKEPEKEKVKETKDK